ncbi:DUF2087 domain-containing protein [Candidatus Clostridium radicumherbarum]|uniref:DUF2087 domain-containing protein n=1 Tax=Candidatus Clostridium radicumherbarum TaxID=3381662 RepID=A0ABW8TQL4_9CLOT
MKGNEILWDSSIDEIKKGYIEGEQEFTCIFCNSSFEKGKIFKRGEDFYDAKKITEIHVKEAHSSSLGYLLNMNSDFTGISEIHREVIKLMAQGLTDKEIATELGIAQSTIRNHRFKLREKEKQARLFLATMELLGDASSRGINVLDKEVIIDSHKTATTLDDRYNITDMERKATIKAYMDETNALKSYPAKEKKKIIVLGEIVKNFSRGRTYTEKEINRVLKRIFEDYATIRRALVEYGFIDRSNDCTKYWVKE